MYCHAQWGHNPHALWKNCLYPRKATQDMEDAFPETVLVILGKEKRNEGVVFFTTKYRGIK